jgi:hypothetical protein
VARGRFPIGSGSLPFTAPQFDLLSTATPLNPPNARWKRGITWEPLCPEADGTYDPCTAIVDNAEAPGEAVLAPAPPEKSATTGWSIRGATAFTAYSRIDCSPVGQWDQLSDVNRQALIRAEARFVETAFWSGVVGGQTIVFPHLAYSGPVIFDGEDLMQPNPVVVEATPQTIAVGLGMLEDAMRDCYPGVATIHMPIRLAALAVEAHLIAPRSGVMYTTTIGSKVVIGDYPGTAPDGTTSPGATWLFATGEVFFARDSAPTVFATVESFDRNVNTVEVLAERTYVIGWDCCLTAIPILNGEL